MWLTLSFQQFMIFAVVNICVLVLHSHIILYFVLMPCWSGYMMDIIHCLLQLCQANQSLASFVSKTQTFLYQHELHQTIYELLALLLHHLKRNNLLIYKEFNYTTYFYKIRVLSCGKL